jgi:hypothetical protein
MTDCSITCSDESKNWPEGVISAKITMNPYILAMAEEESLKKGMRLWELINVAVWEKLGRPSYDKLMKFAAEMEIYEEDPKWKKRLNITARHEVAVAAAKAETAAAMECLKEVGGDGEKPE